MEVFEYVDVNVDATIVQIGNFEKVTNSNQLKKGDKIICPKTEENLFVHPQIQFCKGIKHNQQHNLLLHCRGVNLFHALYSLRVDSKASSAVAWDLCYKLIEDE
jgi:hypothetical protein